MKEIFIISKYGNFTVLVDDEDFEWLSKHKWRVTAPTKNNVFYAKTHIGTKSPLMHRLIYSKYNNLSDTLYVDHEDRNGLNNQKENLRAATESQNGANKIKYIKNASSPYKGVTKHDGGWYSRIKKNKKYVCIGVFDKEIDAAIAYDIKAKELFAEFSNLNIPNASQEDINRVEKIITNIKRHKHSTSIYLGVFKNKKKWGFNIYHDEKNHQCSIFASELDAARARNNYIDKNNLSVSKNIL